MSTLRVDALQTTDGAFSIDVEDLASKVENLSYDGLRSYTGSATSIYITGVAVGDDRAGLFRLNTSAVSPIDNGATRLLDGAGRAWDRSFSGPVNIKWFGAVGDGVADDSTAFNSAIAFTKNAFDLKFPNGRYNILTPVIMSGRIGLLGDGDVTLVGNFAFTDLTFPISADSPTTSLPTSPWLTVRGLMFSTTSTTTPALTVTAQGGSSFIDCMEMRDCKFYGPYGFRGVNLISVTIENCWFYNIYTGIRAEGCVNWNVNGCWFRNARKAGLYITYNADYNNRKGGENIRVANCEFAVCTKGVYAFRHVWLNVDSCLFDYCTLPVELHGSYYAKISNSYLGAANQGSLSGGAGYEAPATLGTALFAHGADADVMGSASYCGVTCVNNELVNYLNGTTLPIAYIEGNLASVPGGKLAERVVFVGNKFLMTQAHAATSMLSISQAEESMVSGNSFVSPNLSSTLTNPYTSSNATVHNGIGNLNSKCLQSGVAVPMTFDYQTSAGLRSTVGRGVWMQTTTGTDIAGVNTAGKFTLSNAIVATAANAGGATALPATPLGFVVININGGDVKIPYYTT